MGYAHKRFDYKVWNLVDKKAIRSKDVVLLKDHTINNFEKVKKPKSITKNYVDPESSTSYHDE